MAKASKKKPKWFGVEHKDGRKVRHRSLVQRARDHIRRKGRRPPWARRVVREDGREVWLMREDVVNPPETEPPWMGVSEAAREAECSRGSINNWYDDGTLPMHAGAARASSKRRIHRTKFRAMLPQLRARLENPRALSTRDPDHLGVFEVRDLLGARSTYPVHRMIRQGRIPTVEVEGDGIREVMIPRGPFMETLPDLKRQVKKVRHKAPPGEMFLGEAAELLGLKGKDPVRQLVDRGEIRINEEKRAAGQGRRILRQEFMDALPRLKTLVRNLEAAREAPGRVTRAHAARILKCNPRTVQLLIEAGKIETDDSPDRRPNEPRRILGDKFREDAPRLRKLIRTHYTQRDERYAGIEHMALLLGMGKKTVQSWIDRAIIPSENRETRKPGERRLVSRERFINGLPLLADLSRSRLSRMGETNRRRAMEAWKRSVGLRRELLGLDDNGAFDDGHNPIMRGLVEREGLSPAEARLPGVQHSLLDRELAWVARASEPEIERRAGMPRRRYVTELTRQARAISSVTPLEDG